MNTRDRMYDIWIYTRHAYTLDEFAGFKYKYRVQVYRYRTGGWSVYSAVRGQKHGHIDDEELEPWWYPLNEPRLSSFPEAVTHHVFTGLNCSAQRLGDSCLTSRNNQLPPDRLIQSTPKRPPERVACRAARPLKNCLATEAPSRGRHWVWWRWPRHRLWGTIRWNVRDDWNEPWEKSYQVRTEMAERMKDGLLTLSFWLEENGN